MKEAASRPAPGRKSVCDGSSEGAGQMPHPTLILLVRLRPDLPLDEVSRIMKLRAPGFAALSGLQQKYCLQDPVSGDYAGR